MYIYTCTLSLPPSLVPRSSFAKTIFAHHTKKTYFSSVTSVSLTTETHTYIHAYTTSRIRGHQSFSQFDFSPFAQPFRFKIKNRAKTWFKGRRLKPKSLLWVQFNVMDVLRSLDCSLDRSIDCSISLSLHRPIARSFYRSFARTHIHTPTRTHIHTPTHINTSTKTHIRTNPHTITHTNTHTHTFTHTHTHTHTLSHAVTHRMPKQSMFLCNRHAHINMLSFSPTNVHICL